jgi:hypothetical protein
LSLEIRIAPLGVEKIFRQEEKFFFTDRTIEEISGTLVSLEPEIGNLGSAPRD